MEEYTNEKRYYYSIMCAYDSSPNIYRMYSTGSRTNAGTDAQRDGDATANTRADADTDAGPGLAVA